jgi:hypothetical protein
MEKGTSSTPRPGPITPRRIADGAFFSIPLVPGSVDRYVRHQLVHGDVWLMTTYSVPGSLMLLHLVMSPLGTLGWVSGEWINLHMEAL